MFFRIISVLLPYVEFLTLVLLFELGYRIASILTEKKGKEITIKLFIVYSILFSFIFIIIDTYLAHILSKIQYVVITSLLLIANVTLIGGLYCFMKASQVKRCDCGHS